MIPVQVGPSRYCLGTVFLHPGKWRALGIHSESRPRVPSEKRLPATIKTVSDREVPNLLPTLFFPRGRPGSSLGFLLHLWTARLAPTWDLGSLRYVHTFRASSSRSDDPLAPILPHHDLCKAHPARYLSARAPSYRTVFLDVVSSTSRNSPVLYAHSPHDG